MAASKPQLTLESIVARAKQNGLGEPFKLFLNTANRHNLYPRLWKTSIMFAPPANKARCLFTIWTQPTRNGLAQVYAGAEALAEFYPISEELADEYLGSSGDRNMSIDDIKAYVSGLDKLFAYAHESQSHQNNAS